LLTEGRELMASEVEERFAAAFPRQHHTGINVAGQPAKLQLHHREFK
jgi:hypothetical protein